MDQSIINQPYAVEDGIFIFKAAQGNALVEQELKSWDKNASFYLEEVKLPLFQLLHRAKLETYELDKEGRLLLDVGAGTGFFCGSLYGAGKKTVALDFSLQMLKLGKQHYKADMWGNASVAELPFRDASFDVVLANGALHHFKAENLLGESVREISRVLKPGGALCIFDRNGSFLSRKVHGFVLAVKAGIVRLLGKFPTSSSEIEPDFTDRDLQLFLDAGFEIERRSFVSSVPFFLMIVATYCCVYAFGFRAGYVAQALLYPVAWLSDRLMPFQSLTVEQCLKLRKKV